jgi:hypothetical protein
MLVQILLSQLCGFAESYLDIKLLFCALFLLTFYINLWEGTVLQIVQLLSTTYVDNLDIVAGMYLQQTEIFHNGNLTRKACRHIDHL